jgi:hypothetical protein
MNHLNYPLALLLVLIVTACTHGEIEDPIGDLPDHIPVFTVLPSSATTVSFNNLAEKVVITPLDLPDGMLLRDVIKMIFRNGQIYFLDRSLTGDSPRIFSFNRDGSFNFVIDRPGNGPGEYELIYDFDLSASEIAITTTTGLMYYSRTDGSFFRNEDGPPGIFLQNFSFLDDNKLILEGGRTRFNQSKNQIKVYDINEKRYLHEAIPFTHHSLKMGHTYRYTFMAGDTLTSAPMYSPVVYRVRNEESEISITPAYAFDFGDSWIDYRILNESYSKRDRFFDSANNYVHTLELFETDNLIYAYYDLERTGSVFMADKSSGNTIHFSALSDNRAAWPLKPLTTDSDFIVSLITPLDVQNIEYELDPELKAITDSASDDGQPILIFTRFSLPL